MEREKSSNPRVEELEKQIVQLEQDLMDKQIKVDFLEKMIELAGDELDVDIKKNYSTPPPGGSGESVKK